MKIKDMAKIQIGYQFRGKLEPDPKGTHQVIQIKDIDLKKRLDASDLYRVTPEGAINRYLVDQGDVLFQSRGKDNPAIPITDPMMNTIATSYFYILKLETGQVIPEYLAWYLNQPPSQGFIQSRARGSGMLMIPKKDFIELDVDVPSMEIQKAIMRLDELQRKEGDLLRELEIKRRLLIQGVCLRAAKTNSSGT